MRETRAILFASVFAIALALVLAHGRVTDPPHRGYAWRRGFDTPREYTDNENFCGGVGKQYGENGGKCGACGDDYAIKPPRPNENGGVYGTGTIVQTYKAGQEIDVNVQVTASHFGYFEFALCPLKGPKDIETEECFENHKLRFASGDDKYYGITEPRDYPVRLQLPKDLSCEHCTLRWHYRTGNNWGECGNGTGALGCGDQEIFRSCSDIRILGAQHPTKLYD